MRRDAHPLNWIATSNGEVIALDLEAHGWRPAGYELAQLTDDQPMIPVDGAGWAERKSLAHRYAAGLTSGGLTIDHKQLTRAYEASLIARSVRLLTMPSGGIAYRQHAEALLAFISERAMETNTRRMANEVLLSWQSRSGARSDASKKSAQISAARRRHLSRGIAYQLRHNHAGLTDEFGWAPVEDLARVLQALGHKTSVSELLSVATAVDEPRFEVTDGSIRARYGHTTGVDVQYEIATNRGTLYHGTSFDNLAPILGRREGLKPGRRQWVHLSSDPASALLTARRHGPGVLLAVESDALELYAAGGPVFLTEAVPADLLTVVTPTSLLLRALDSVAV